MPNIHDKWAQTPLHHCLCAQFLDTARAVLNHAGLDAGYIINSQDVKGKTCLHIAAESASAEAVEMLITHGADVNVSIY